MKLPDFKTKEEEIRFWERHSIGDYWEDLLESNDTFKRPKLKPVSIKFDPLVLQKVKMLAKKEEPVLQRIYKISACKEH